MSSEAWFVVLLLAVGAERVVELVVSERNRRWSMARGGVESGLGHYPVMVVLHLGLLIGALVEVLLSGRDFHPWLGFPMVALVLTAQVLRWWCISTLGRQWCTRVVVVPGLAPVTGGPYRWLRHPNYVAVAVEGLALPLVHTAWITALVFSVADTWLLRVRVSVEERALALLVIPAPSESPHPTRTTGPVA